MSDSTLKQKVGCWLHERWRAEVVLRAPRLARLCGLNWVDLCNRSEQLHVDTSSGGRICGWQDSSQLTLTGVFPAFASRLLAHVLDQWRFTFNKAGASSRDLSPTVSVLIPIGGSERLPQFELTLQAARAQTDVGFEIVVVEQSPEPKIFGRLPADVRYFHQKSSLTDGFNKSSALNLAAHEARGDALIVLDADYLIPERFAAECVRVLRTSEAARPARWIFYLDRLTSERLSASPGFTRVAGIERIVANNPTPLAVRRSTYWEIGGHDESYVGWGGEDSEFLDRLRTRKISEGGWMPVIHVWHAPARKKADGDRNRALHQAKMAVSPVERIAALAGTSE